VRGSISPLARPASALWRRGRRGGVHPWTGRSASLPGGTTAAEPTGHSRIGGHSTSLIIRVAEGAFNGWAAPWPFDLTIGVYSICHPGILGACAGFLFECDSRANKSRQTTRICDRCRGVCVEQSSVVKIEAGDLARQLPTEPLDLCEDCSGLFLSWLRSGHQAAHVDPGRTANVKSVRLPARRHDEPEAILRPFAHTRKWFPCAPVRALSAENRPDWEKFVTSACGKRIYTLEDTRNPKPERRR
jgi:hypothetical protein